MQGLQVCLRLRAGPEGAAGIKKPVQPELSSGGYPSKGLISSRSVHSPWGYALGIPLLFSQNVDLRTVLALRGVPRTLAFQAKQSSASTF